MTEWNIQLKADGFNNWLEFMEQNITSIKDRLVMLESEERQLSGIWESGAKEQWEAGFIHELEQVKNSISGIWEVLTATQEAAEKLARLERNMTQEAQRL